MANPLGKAEGKAEGGGSVGPLKVSYTDAPNDLLDEVVAAATRALKAQSRGEVKYLHEVAAAIKKDCSAKMPGAWHVFVGSSFGSFVTHEAGTMCYFFLGATGVLAFKHG